MLEGGLGIFIFSGKAVGGGEVVPWDVLQGLRYLFFSDSLEGRIPPQ